MANQSQQICYLCGSTINSNASEEELRLSMDHVPPKQFFPKQVRIDENLNLELAPSHKKCNNAYKDDEDYFYHSLYPLVANNNPDMAQTVFRDFERRSSHPQTPAMLKKIFSSASGTTSGGIILPGNKVEINVDLARIQRIAGKIARGIIFLATQEFFPEASIVDMRICESESEVPEMYRLSWKASTMETTYTKVFSSRCFPHDGHFILSLMFWEAFMFCVTVKSSNQ